MPGKKLRCEVCGKGLVDEDKLRDHVDAHTLARPHLFKFCGPGFAADGTQWRHEMTCAKNSVIHDASILQSRIFQK